MSNNTAGTAALKVLVVGNSNSGKSCLTLRFVEEEFTQNFIPTIGIDFHVKIISLGKAHGGRRVKLQIWDTAGQERFNNVTRAYYRGAAVVLLVYDVCDRDSFEWIPKWRDQVVEYIGDASSVILAVVGNKSDRPSSERKVTSEEGRACAERLGVEIFMETSAKTGDNVTELFTAVAEAAAARLPPPSNLADEASSSLNLASGSRGGGSTGAKAGAADSCGCGGSSGPSAR